MFPFLTFDSYRLTNQPVSPQQENAAETWLAEYDASLMDPLMRLQIKDKESFPPQNNPCLYKILPLLVGKKIK